MFVVILFSILDAEIAVNSVLSAFYAHLEKPLNFDPFGQVEFAPLALM
jgi:hypothetical protein